MYVLITDSNSSFIHESALHLITKYILGMGPSTCSLDARSVLSDFDGARARVLESEQMLVLARARG